MQDGVDGAPLDQFGDAVLPDAVAADHDGGPGGEEGGGDAGAVGHAEADHRCRLGQGPFPVPGEPGHAVDPGDQFFVAVGDLLDRAPGAVVVLDVGSQAVDHDVLDTVLVQQRLQAPAAVHGVEDGGADRGFLLGRQRGVALGVLGGPVRDRGTDQGLRLGAAVGLLQELVRVAGAELLGDLGLEVLDDLPAHRDLSGQSGQARNGGGVRRTGRGDRGSGRGRGRGGGRGGSSPLADPAAEKTCDLLAAHRGRPSAAGTLLEVSHAVHSSRSAAAELRRAAGSQPGAGTAAGSPDGRRRPRTARWRYGRGAAAGCARSRAGAARRW